MHTMEHAVDFGAFADSDARPIWRVGATAVALASAVNGALYVAAAPLDLFPQWVHVPGFDAPITLARVVVMTALGVAAGVLLLAALRRLVAHPYRVFCLVAVATLLASYTQPSMVLSDAPLRMVLALNVLHTTAAAVAVWTLRRAAAPLDVVPPVATHQLSPTRWHQRWEPRTGDHHDD